MNNLPILTRIANDATVPEYIKRYIAGESMQVLAAELGCNRATLYRHMLTDLGEQQHHDLITAMLVTRIAEADDRLEEAQDAVATSRAREQARFARMDYERRRPLLYGSRQQLDITHHKSYSDTLRSLDDDLIQDAELVPDTEQDNEQSES